MKSVTDTTSPTPGTEDPAGLDIDGLLAKWPDVAAPPGGYEALADRSTQRARQDGSVDESVDVLGRPDLGDEGKDAPHGASNGTAAERSPDLDTLAALARESAPPRRESRRPTEGESPKSNSGVINFKALIEQGAAEEAAEAKALQDAIHATAKPAPAATTLPSTPTTVPTAALAKPAPAKKSNGATWALVAVIGVAAVVAYTTVGNQRSPSRVQEEPAAAADDLREAEPAEADSEHTQVAAAEAPSAGDRQQAATAEPSAPATEAASNTARNAEANSDDRTSARRAVAATTRRTPAESDGRPAPEGHAAATAPAAAPAAPAAEAAAPAPTKRGTADLDDLISGSLGPAGRPAPGQPVATTAAAAPPEGALPQPNRQQIQRAMGRVAGAVRGCANGQPGMAMVRVTFTSDGSVSNAAMAGGPFAGTPAAGCIENAVRSARVPAFTNPSVSINYPFVIQPPDPAAAAPAAP